MIHFRDFLVLNNLLDTEFHILGKGSSLSLYKAGENENKTTISLNHVVRDTHVKIAHMIDIDVLYDIQDVVEENAEYLLLPFYPHVNNSPSHKNLKNFIQEIDVLDRYQKRGRLLWYNLRTTWKLKWPYHISTNGHFSGDVVVGLLASSGVKKIKIAGIDGGTSYNQRFQDLNEKTLLSNGKASFDLQFEFMRDKIMNNDLQFSSVTDEYPIRVFIATTEDQMLATKVLEYSIKRHTEKDVEIFPMHLSNISYDEPNNIENRQRTPFSFQRFLIPQLCNYQGKGIYLDSDMQVFTDINNLWALPMGGNDLLTVKDKKDEGRRMHFSVMLLNCKALDWKITDVIEGLDSGKFNYHELMHDMVLANNISADIDAGWNCLEYFDKKASKLVHYTDMATQPWVSFENHIGSLWTAELRQAIDEGFIDTDYVKKHIENGWVRPSLLWQVENKKDKLTRAEKSFLKKLDKGFIAPYHSLNCAQGALNSSIVGRVKAGLKRRGRETLHRLMG